VTRPLLLPPDVVLRNRIIVALAAVPLTAGITSRVPYGRLADAVLGIGRFSVMCGDGLHLHQCSDCLHGRPHRFPADFCTDCGAGCRATFAGTSDQPDPTGPHGGLAGAWQITTDVPNPRSSS
jgi:hypothetical protein